MTNTDTMNTTGEQQGLPTLAELYPIPDGAIELRRFLGTWSMNGTLAVEGSPLAMFGTVEVTSAAAGWGVEVLLDAEIAQLGGYHEINIFGFNAETGMVHIYSITNTGAVHDHPATWVTPDTLEFEYRGTQDGKPYVESGRAEFLSPDRLHLTSAERVDGAMQSEMDVIMERQ